MAERIEYEAVKTIATPFYALKVGIPTIVRIDEKFKLGRKNPAKPDETPGMVALCTILDGEGQGEQFTVGFSAIPHNTIMEAYKDHGYVGKAFKLTKMTKTGGGKANPFAVQEVKARK